MRVLSICLAVLLFCALCWTLTGSTLSQPEQNLSPGWNENAETLARGVDAWCKSVGTIEGIATVEVFVSQREIIAQKEVAEYGVVGPVSHTRYTSRGLNVCRFFLGAGEWHCELAEIVPCGINPWGMALKGSQGKELTEVSSAEDCPVSYSISDGQKVILYNAAFGLADIKDYEEQDCYGQPMRSIRRALLLTERKFPFGEMLLQRLHNEHDSQPTELVRAVPGDAIDTVNCWRLEIYFRSGGSLIRYSVWIAPDRGYMPMAFESLGVDDETRDKGMRHCTRVVAAEEVAPGIWVPTESIYAWYVYEPRRESNWYRMFRVGFSDLRVNVRQQTFDVLPPLGTSVRDMRDIRAERVVFGQLGRLDQALEEFRRAEPPQLDPDMDSPLTGRELSELFPEE